MAMLSEMITFIWLVIWFLISLLIAVAMAGFVMILICSIIGEIMNRCKKTKNT